MIGQRHVPEKSALHSAFGRAHCGPAVSVSISKSSLVSESRHWTKCNSTPLPPTDPNPSPPRLLSPPTQPSVRGDILWNFLRRKNFYCGGHNITILSYRHHFFFLLYSCVCTKRVCLCVRVSQWDWGRKSDESPVLKAFVLSGPSAAKCLRLLLSHDISSWLKSSLVCLLSILPIHSPLFPTPLTQSQTAPPPFLNHFAATAWHNSGEEHCCDSSKRNRK